MNAKEFESLKIGDVCEVIRGKDSGKKCVVLHKDAQIVDRYMSTPIMVVLAKPQSPDDNFDSPTVAYRYFKLFAHSELKRL